MTKSLHLICIVILLAYVVVYSLRYFVKFKNFCNSIAKLEGRTADLADFMTDEGGLNKYQIQIFKNIAAGGYSNLDDTELSLEANALREKLVMGYVWIFLVILLLIFYF